MIAEEQARILVEVWLRDEYHGFAVGSEFAAKLVQRIAAALRDEHALWKREAELYIRHRARAERLAAALRALFRGTCWCEVAIGNPNYRGRHRTGCLMAQTAIAIEDALARDVAPVLEGEEE